MTADYPRKVDYVLKHQSGKHRDPTHTCHWPGCERIVPPAMWGCKSHWFALPAGLRAKIWRTYKPGQETSKTPDAAYLDAARQVQEWIREHPNG